MHSPGRVRLLVASSSDWLSQHRATGAAAALTTDNSQSWVLCTGAWDHGDTTHVATEHELASRMVVHNVHHIYILFVKLYNHMYGCHSGCNCFRPALLQLLRFAVKLEGCLMCAACTPSTASRSLRGSRNATTLGQRVQHLARDTKEKFATCEACICRSKSGLETQATSFNT